MVLRNHFWILQTKVHKQLEFYTWSLLTELDEIFVFKTHLRVRLVLCGRTFTALLSFMLSGQAAERNSLHLSLVMEVSGTTTRLLKPSRAKSNSQLHFLYTVHTHLPLFPSADCLSICFLPVFSPNIFDLIVGLWFCFTLHAIVLPLNVKCFWIVSRKKRNVNFKNDDVMLPSTTYTQE